MGVGSLPFHDRSSPHLRPFADQPSIVSGVLKTVENS